MKVGDILKFDDLDELFRKYESFKKSGIYAQINYEKKELLIIDIVIESDRQFLNII